MRITSPLFVTVRHHNSRFMDQGLFGGQKIRFGKNVTEFGKQSPRKFELNMLWSNQHSVLLNRPVRVRLTTAVMRTIDNIGGLDNYIMGQRRLENEKAETLKKAMVLAQWRRELASKSIPMKYNLLTRKNKLV